MNKDIIEAGKEGLRVVALAIIPILVESLNSGEVNWKLVGITAAVAALRTLDAWLHERAKDVPVKSRNEGWLGLKGLTAF